MKDPQLEPGEAIAFAHPNVGLALFKSGVTYRAVVDIPVLQDVGLYITDRRVILRGELFATLFDRDVSYRFPDGEPQPDVEEVTGATCGSNDSLGPYLVIHTRSDRDRVLRQRDAQLQVFMAEAETALAALPSVLRRAPSDS